MPGLIVLLVGRALFFLLLLYLLASFLLLCLCLSSFLMLSANRLCQRLLIIERPGKWLLIILGSIRVGWQVSF